MGKEFPEYACKYAKELAKKSRAFARQVSAAGEKEGNDGYLADPFGEQTKASRCWGLKQRFEDRVLIMTANKCFMNCRHCTRRGILEGAEVVTTEEQLERCKQYILAHKKVRDVLLSGGDILTHKDERVEWFVNAFAEMEQIEIVRVCTRAICANPGRITNRLARALACSRKVWVNTQFNCAEEVTKEAVEAARKLIERGIPVSCQTVLLKGVNDTPRKMLELLKALSAARIRPYYVFQCDPVAGIERFRVKAEKALAIERYCAEHIGGLALPRFVADIPGKPRKMPLNMI